MLQLNQPTPSLPDSSVTREYEYKLPDYLVKKGDKCFFKIEAKSLEECTAAMGPDYEQFLRDTKVTNLHLNRRIDKVTEAQKDPYDRSNPVIEQAYTQFAEDDTKASQKFMRALTEACFKKCIISWETNILAGDVPVESTDKNIKDLILLAYPDGGFTKHVGLSGMFSDLRDDVFKGKATERDADNEADEEELKNS